MSLKPLEEYRKKSKIDTTELAYLIIRGKERFTTYVNMTQAVMKVVGFNDPRIFEMSRENLYALTMEKSAAVYSNVHVDNINANYLYESGQSFNQHWRGSIGAIMVIQLILAMGTEEQKALFLPNIDKFIWTTAYAQTELSHGSDVEGIQTTAVFDDVKDEFIINTPSLEAMKWWPGDLGLSATHIILVARLIAKGVDHGAQCFFIQIRDLETHKWLPGIETGDIGFKLGYLSKDNGFIRFTNFRVPKICLLEKYITVKSNGDVIKIGNDRIKFTGMMRARTLLLMSSYWDTIRILTITTRYSILRKQFKDSSGEEIPIINYQLQRYKIVKHLCKTYVMCLGLYRVMELITQNEELVPKGDYSQFQQVHLMLCQCKAFFTAWDFSCISESIQTCGGHGYSAYSGLTHSFTENFANTILEGENSLLCLQVARYLLNLAKKSSTGDTAQIQGQFAYLLDGDDLEEFNAETTKEALTDPKIVLKILRKNAAFFVKKTSMSFMKYTLEGVDLKDAWNKHMGLQLLNMARCHSIVTLTDNFYSKLLTLEEGPIKSAILSLGVIYTHEIFKEFSSSLFESGSLKGEHMELIIELLEEHIEKLTPDLLVLAEGIPIADEVLMSAIAHNNCKPYENLYDWAKKYGSLNHLPDGVHPEIAKTLRELRQQRL